MPPCSTCSHIFDRLFYVRTLGSSLNLSCWEMWQPRLEDAHELMGIGHDKGKEGGWSLLGYERSLDVWPEVLAVLNWDPCAFPCHSCVWADTWLGLRMGNAALRDVRTPSHWPLVLPLPFSQTPQHCQLMHRSSKTCIVGLWSCWILSQCIEHVLKCLPKLHSQGNKQLNRIITPLVPLPMGSGDGCVFEMKNIF